MRYKWVMIDPAEEEDVDEQDADELAVIDEVLKEVLGPEVEDNDQNG